MDNKEMHILVAVVVLALLSVGAYLLSKGEPGQLAVPDPSTLPATPAAPLAPPIAIQEDASFGADGDFNYTEDYTQDPIEEYEGEEDEYYDAAGTFEEGSAPETDAEDLIAQ